MDARELLTDLAGAGLSVTAEDDRLVIRPASRLTDDMRAALREAKPELLALLTMPTPGAALPPNRPYRLSQADGDRCHVEPWDDACIALFVARVGRFLRLGIDATDADDLAERLVLRDRDGDARVSCIECRHYRLGRCGNHGRAGLLAPDVGRDLATLLQRCPAFVPVETAR